METLEARIARHPFVAAQLDADGRITDMCEHHHGRSDTGAIASARGLGWEGFAELLVTDDAPVRPLDAWRFRDGATTHRERLGVVTGIDVALTRQL